MHIVISGLFWDKPTVGSGQYLHGLLRWLPHVAPHHRYTLLLPTHSCHPSPSPPVTTHTVPTPFDRIGGSLAENLAKLWFEQIGVPRVARLLAGEQRDSTLLHVPYFAPPGFPPVPVVTTIPDIIPLILRPYRGGLHVRAYMHLVRRTIHRSRHIVTFSRHSRHDITAHLALAPERVTATLLAADERYTAGDRQEAVAAVARRYHLNAPFVYYVGGLDARKNVEVLVLALALLRQAGQQPPTLVVAGKAPGTDRQLFPDLDSLISERDVGDLVRRIEVPHEDGPLLYRAATLFVFPSRYEGFGLPPLEAMACGTPVLCSKASSLPEVVGEAAICLDPDDADGWAQSMMQLLSDDQQREEMRQRGYEQAARFSWQRVAEETARVYEEAAGITVSPASP